MREISLDSARQLLLIRFPYDEGVKAVVRDLPRRRWEPSDRCWTVPAVYADQVCDALLPLGFQAESDVLQRAGHSDMSVSMPAAERRLQTRGQVELPSQDALTVSQLNATARAAIRAAMPRPVWLVGEVVGFDRGSRGQNVFFELVEKAEQGIAARVSAVLWSGDAMQVRRTLAKAGDPFALGDGIVVRVLVEVDLYGPSGRFQVQVRNIDPVYTLGDIAKRREAVLAAMEQEGIAARNLELPFPQVPLRIALLTSRAGEACRDVLSQLQQSGVGFHVDLLDVAVQGKRLSESVCRALRQVQTRQEQGRAYDVVLLVRGGGSRTDLAWFDDVDVARAVCRSKLKVVVGIGHQRDQCALDFVAHSVKTPTAAAQVLIEQVGAFIQSQDTLWERMERVATSRVRDARSALRERAHRLSSRSLQHVVHHRAYLELAPDDLLGRATQATRRLRASADRAEERLGGAAPRSTTSALASLDDATRRLTTGALERRLRSARRELERAAITAPMRAQSAVLGARLRLEHAAEALSWKDPRRLIARGYARVRRASGQVVTAAAAVERGETLAIEMRGGSLHVEVRDITLEPIQQTPEEQPEDRAEHTHGTQSPPSP